MTGDELAFLTVKAMFASRLDQLEFAIALHDSGATVKPVATVDIFDTIHNIMIRMVRMTADHAITTNFLGCTNDAIFQESRKRFGMKPSGTWPSASKPARCHQWHRRIELVTVRNE